MRYRRTKAVEDTLPRMLQDGTDGYVTFETDDLFTIEGVIDTIMLEEGGRLLFENVAEVVADVTAGSLLLEHGGKLLEETD